MITLNCDKIEPATKKKGERTSDRRLEIKKTSACLYFSVPLLINFPFHAFFFGMSSVLA